MGVLWAVWIVDPNVVRYVLVSVVVSDAGGDVGVLLVRSLPFVGVSVFVGFPRRWWHLAPSV